jgi:hypothetical protein
MYFYCSPNIEMTRHYANFVVYLTTFSVSRVYSICMKMLYGMETDVYFFLIYGCLQFLHKNVFLKAKIISET